MTNYQDKNLKGYELCYDETGKPYFIDKKTGEHRPAVVTLLPQGSITYTPQSQEEYERRKEAARKKAEAELQRRYNQEQNNELGSFYFLESKDRRNAMTPQSMTRLLFLATYLRYGSNVLYATERTKMTKDVLPQLLRIKGKTFYRFWYEVEGTYLIENTDGTLSLSDEFCRGNITSRLQTNHTTYHKIFIKTLRNLYYRTPITKHRYLGYIFSMLPFINVEYNIMCWNPDEKDIQEIQPMTLDQFCSLLDYNKTQKSRLIDAYEQLTFEWKGLQQRFCGFATDNPKSRDFKIFVNPRILYRGSNWKQVEGLCAFFNPLDKKDKAI